MKLLLSLLFTATFGGIAVLLAGFAGRFHGLGDSLAVFRMPVSVGLLILGGGLWALEARVAGAIAAAVAVLGLATVLAHRLPGTGTAEAAATVVTLYQKNLLAHRDGPDAIVADIRATGPDIVTLQEVNERNRAVLAALSDLYPTQVVCRYAAVGGVAVLSRFPMRPGSLDCVEKSGLVSVVLETRSGPIRAASVHLHWPWPHGQPGQVDDLAPRIAGWTEPVLMGGDFNMVRWSSALRRIGRASGTSPVGPARLTLRGKRGILYLAIDHVLAPRGAGVTERRPRAGSDHDGILARIPLR